MLFEGINVYSGRRTSIQVANGRIAGMRDAGAACAGDTLYLSRGFTDIQVNGYRGLDYSGENLSEAGVLQLIADLACAGTLRHLPTIITGSGEQTEKNLARLSALTAGNPVIAEAIAGFHLEGPYLSPKEGARGAHDPQFIRKPDFKELEGWQRAARGMIKLITVAPELEGMAEFIRSAVGMGIKVAIGHSLATDNDIAAAVAAGAGMSTHLGNGSPAMLPRFKNPIWAQMAEDRLMASLITDGFHLPAAVIKSMARAKGLERLILVSDAGPLGGLQPGRHRWGSTQVDVYPDGHLGLAGTEYLAGAGHLLDRCIAVFRRATDASLRETLACVIERPAAFIGLPRATGDFKVGEAADIIAFEEDSQQLRVLQWASGQSHSGQ